MKLRTISAATVSLLVLSLALAGCPKKGSDSGTDAATGTDAANTDAANTDAANTDSATTTDGGTTGATLTALVYEVLDDTNPVAGATVDLFDVTDNTKTTSLATGTSDAAGLAALSLATVPASVYARVTPAMGIETFTYWNYPVTADTSRDTAFYSTTSWGIVAMFGQTPGNGYASGAIVDCMGARVAGATVTASSGTVIYINGILPDPTAMMTDASGSYVVTNAAPGALTLDIDTGTGTAGCATTTASHDVFSRADVPLIAVTLVP